MAVIAGVSLGLAACSSSGSRTATTGAGTSKPAAGATTTATAIPTYPPPPAGTPDPCTLLTAADFTAASLPFTTGQPMDIATPNAGGGSDRQCEWISTPGLPYGYVYLRVRGDGAAGHDRDIAAEQAVMQPLKGIGDQAFEHLHTEWVNVKVGLRAFAIQLTGTNNNPKAAEALAVVVAGRIGH
jgi:hypothetical protein